MLKTPIAFIVFNRPDVTKRVFETIRAARPPRLLVIADGPRRPDEAAACDECRKIATSVDWPCEVLTNFSETNLGCMRRVASGLDWAFQEVEEAIVLEDDCIPEPSFFPFCETLLERYRDDERIMAICGSQYIDAAAALRSGYLYSEFLHVWGWASWRRAWQKYDVDMKSWPLVRDDPGFPTNRRDPKIAAMFRTIFDKQHNHGLDTWDIQWHYACLVNSGLTILPTRNLVSNIGFRADATHTVDPQSRFANARTWPASFPLIPPIGVFPATEIDDAIVHTMLPRPPSFSERLRGKVKRVLAGKR